MRFGIVVFPGSNCDHDCYHAVKHVLGEKADFIFHKEKRLKGNYDCIILPGGFSYGDYLRAGAIARFSPIMAEVTSFAQKGGLVLGICNGFQVLLEAHFLPGAMLRNDSLKFVCKEIYIRLENSGTPFTNKGKVGQVLALPIAHGEGNYYDDKETIRKMEDKGQIVFRYCSKEGDIVASANPNGSIGNIAGITNEKGNILGMMPHPERGVEEILGSESGRIIFDSIIAWCHKRT